MRTRPPTLEDIGPTEPIEPAAPIVADFLARLGLPHSRADLERDTGLRVRSGSISCRSPLVAFLYLLARDLVPVGRIEEFLEQVEPLREHGAGASFSNGWLATWAADSADRLTKAPTPGAPPEMSHGVSFGP